MLTRPSDRPVRNNLEASRRFWDEKAKEQPYWYISSFTDFARPDLEAFWASGVQIWKDLKATTSYTPSRRHAVLEVGCGIGRLSRVIAPEVGRLVSVDISGEMIILAQRHNPKLTFEVIAGSSFTPYEAQSFDLVVAYCVWQHLPSHGVFEECISDAFRILRPAGRLIFTYTPWTLKSALRPLIRLRAAVKQVAQRHGPRGLYRHEWLGIRLTPAEATAACRKAGFVHVDSATLRGDKQLVAATKA